MAFVNDVLTLVFRHSYSLQPGIVIENFGKNSLRNVFLSETAISEIERVISDQGDSELLYQIGKEFGYSYAKAVPLPKFSAVLKETVFQGVLDFFQTTYGMSSNYNIDWKELKFEIHGKNVIVCKKNGLGNLILLGGWAGLLGFMLQNKEVEGIQTKCEGKGDVECLGIFSPNQSGAYVYPDFEDIEYGQIYSDMNQPIPSPQGYGLDQLMQVGVANYSTNAILISDERFFPIEVTFLYHLENKLPKYTQLIFDTTYASIKKITQDRIKQKIKISQTSQAIDFTARLFTALGWGVIQYYPVSQSKAKVSIQSFPWTKELNQTELSSYFKGAFLGMINGLSEKEVQMNILSVGKGATGFEVLLELTIKE